MVLEISKKVLFCSLGLCCRQKFRRQKPELKKFIEGNDGYIYIYIYDDKMWSSKPIKRGGVANFVAII
jgi:hypothetical protein